MEPCGGLANLGATCYLNTAVQCLGYCNTFRTFVLENKEKYKKAAPSLFEALALLYEDLWVHKKSVLPRRFVGQVESVLSTFDIYNQNDINEFLLCFLDKLNASIAQTLDVPPPCKEIIKSTGVFETQKNRMEIAWWKMIHKEYSPIMDIFYGQSISQIICGSCQHIHHNYELYSVLMIPIKGDTLEQCLTEYFEDHTLYSWKCDKCEKTENSVQTHKLWSCPPILLISLKRFTSDLKKIDREIQVPEIINMKKHVMCSQSSMYELKAVAMHVGTHYGGGHYFAFVRESGGGWLMVDDTQVSKVDSIPRIGLGYVYFYQRS